MDESLTSRHNPFVASAQDPTLFIGSSAEGLAVAENLQVVLEEHCEASVWTQGSFGLSGTTIASLLQETQRFDYAALILTPDDLVTRRGHARPAARDNVLFEVGLFIGAIGIERTFLICCQDDRLDLPSDLDGVTRLTYKRRVDGNLRSALSRVKLAIKAQMERLGVRGASAPVLNPAESMSSVPSRSLEEERELLAQEL
jgi:predicted nucleotide-binding protein